MYGLTPQWGIGYMPGLGQDDGDNTLIDTSTIDTTPIDVSSLPVTTTSIPLTTIDTSGLDSQSISSAVLQQDLQAFNQAPEATQAELLSQISLPAATTVTNSSGQQVTAPAGSYKAPAQSSTQAWAAFATQLAKSGMTLAEISAIQPGEVVLPNGTVIGSATSAAGSNTLSSLLGGTNSTYLLMGGAVLLLVLLMSRK